VAKRERVSGPKLGESGERRVTVGVFCQRCGWLHTVVPDVKLSEVNKLAKSFKGYVCLKCKFELMSPKVMIFEA